MSILKKIDPVHKEDRLEKWRNERLEKALEEKEIRVRAREIQKHSDAERKKLQRSQAAKALLPTATELEKQEQAILKQKEGYTVKTFFQFACCVILPIFAGLYYFLVIATPLYEVRAVAVVSKGSAAGTSQQVGLFNSVATPTNLNDVFKAQAFVQSQAMMNYLEEEQGIVTRWTSDDIDPIMRLRSIESLGITKQMQLSRFLESSVDIQTGLLTLKVRDPDQTKAAEIAALVLHQTENRLNELSETQFSVQISKAEEAVETAKKDLIVAQNELAKRQAESGEADPRLRVAGVYDTIRQLETEAMTLESEVHKAEIAGRGESFLTGQTRELAQLLRSDINQQRSLLVEGVNNAPSLNAVMLEYDRASLSVRIAEDTLKNAFDNLAAVSRTAAENQSLLQVIVPPNGSAVPLNANGLPTLTLIAVLSLAIFASMRVFQAGRDTAAP